jgi:hypothetical protein
LQADGERRQVIGRRAALNGSMAMTVRIELQLDMDSYRKKYGPGSDFEKKYGPREWTETPAEIKALVEDVINEGFYDWDNEGWLKTNVQVD